MDISEVCAERSEILNGVMIFAAKRESFMVNFSHDQLLKFDNFYAWRLNVCSEFSRNVVQFQETHTKFPSSMKLKKNWISNMNKSGKGRQNFKIRNKNIGHFMKRQIPICGIFASKKRINSGAFFTLRSYIIFLLLLLLKAGMGNGEWRMENGKCGVENED